MPLFSPVSAFPRSPEHPKNSWRLMCCNAILRGAEVLGFVGWNVLKEGESKNKGKGFHSFASQAARKPAEREWNSETERRTAAAPARLVHSSCGGRAGRGGGGASLCPHIWNGTCEDRSCSSAPVTAAAILASVLGNHCTLPYLMNSSLSAEPHAK